MVHHSVTAKSLTGFGTAAIQESILKSREVSDERFCRYNTGTQIGCKQREGWSLIHGHDCEADIFSSNSISFICTIWERHALRFSILAVQDSGEKFADNTNVANYQHLSLESPADTILTPDVYHSVKMLLANLLE